jgi:hypothetical protein
MCPILAISWLEDLMPDSPILAELRVMIEAVGRLSLSQEESLEALLSEWVV